MKSPWAGVRKRVDRRHGTFAYATKGYEGYIDATPQVESILADADTLLVVVRADIEYDAAFLEWYDATVNTNDEERIAKAKSRQARAIATRREAIAALPKHLKE